ncbi:5113_t:CDS:2, partial [Entrophospora sp. SA101]
PCSIGIMLLDLVMDEDEELANPFNNLLTDDNNQQVLAHKAVFFLDGLRDQT